MLPPAPPPAIVLPITYCATPAYNKAIIDVTTAGATPNDGLSDAAAIQSVIDSTSANLTTAYIPAGTYNVAANQLVLKTNTTLVLHPQAVIQMAPTSSGTYSLFDVTNVNNVNVSGGTIIADRLAHTGTTGEWGMGAYIRTATNVNFESITVKDAWGDGIYIGINSANVKLCKVTVDNARRNGVSITSANNVFIDQGVYKNTHGTLPQSGIGLEPNVNETVSNVTIKGAELSGNHASGFYAGWVQSATGASITGVTLDGNNIHDNGLDLSTTFAYGILLDKQVGAVVKNNTINNNKNAGIYVDSNTTGSQIFDNTITNNGAFGIPLDNTVSNSLIKTNTITGHTTCDIISWSTGTGNVWQGNTVIKPCGTVQIP
jgi:parallel beta-helix repeat protein